MTFGILTFHRAHNYGAMLQAIALRTKLAENGDSVFFIDYWPEWHQQEYNIFNKQVYQSLSPLRKLNYIRKYFRDRTAKKQRIEVFEHFYKRFINPYTVDGENIEFDAIFYGSDQIWRKGSDKTEWYDDVMFGHHHYRTKSHIAYAASMGVIHEDIKDLNYFKASLQRFDAIGVRETDLKLTLEKAGITDMVLTIDPTFLLKKEKWNDILEIKIDRREKYILFYDLMYGSFDLNAIKRFAAERNLPLKVLKSRIDKNNYGVETISCADPREFVKLIANAEYVFTSSFHGLAFSLIFGRQFYASYRYNSGRASTILSSLSLSTRLLPTLSKSIPDLPAIDYNTIDKRMDDLRKDSLQFLKYAIDSIR